VVSLNDWEPLRRGVEASNQREGKEAASRHHCLPRWPYRYWALTSWCSRLAIRFSLRPGQLPVNDRLVVVPLPLCSVEANQGTHAVESSPSAGATMSSRSREYRPIHARTYESEARIPRTQRTRISHPCWQGYHILVGIEVTLNLLSVAEDVVVGWARR